ncbi:GbsR/MarR family transcriptional regulator [Kitasatospora cathayae]|uniref:Helix-turn-helix domain-containing protein n=1 Tax=Kitasatospora cathayae TaxID=3004092 RepID=A0ABY7QEM3_9ACTN|nr:MarR family transcriptional regulator [Kitasatospora sp. HUAS 3-15]WBP91202.1 helix-turn-helix domain-containing protein [Kitasatospora sp. HUAS 3-15]
MPGGRLTQQDRRQIAAGLADGLSYTEIAKRLERPTSTITREVMRNGGPNDYRPDQAHRATERRAKRRRPTAQSPAASPAQPDPYGRDPEAVQAFETHLTDLFEGTGFPRMTASVLACLHTTDSGSLTAAELTERLKVSPASVSKAVGYLEAQELVRRRRDPGARRDRYVIDEDVWFRAMIASARMNATLAEAVHKGSGILGPTTPAGERLEDMGQFLEHMGRDLVRAAEHWREVFSAREA